MAEWIAEGEPSARPLGDGHPPLRRPVPLALLHAHARIERGLRDLLRHPLPRPRAPAPGGRCASRRAYAWHREHGAAFGEKSGWERVNWYESNAAAGDESLRPRGWAGQHWSPAIGAEHRATPRGARRSSTSPRSRSSRSTGPGAAEFLEGLCDNRVARERRRRSPTRRCSTAAAGSSATSPSRGSREERFSIVTGTAFGNHDREWIRRHLPGDGSVRVAAT